MISKIIHLAIALLFIYFSYVQLDDLDAWKWIIIYSSIALLAFLKFADIKITLFAKIISICIGLYIILNINLFVSWTKAGFPAFIDYAPTDVREVENIREFLGLAIAFGTALIYWLLLRKKGEKV